MKALKKFLALVVPGYEFTRLLGENPLLTKDRQFVSRIFYQFIPLTFFFTWAFSLIPYIGSSLYITLMILGGILLYQEDGKNGKKNALFYFVVMSWGFLGIRSFVGHTFLADTVADSIGWEKGSPFQIELAFYHLGLAAATLSYIWNRSRALLLGLILSKSIFLFGAMAVHIYETITYANFNPGNISIGIIYGDLVLPLLIIFLYRKTVSPNKSSQA